MNKRDFIHNDSNLRNYQFTGEITQKEFFMEKTKNNRFWLGMFVLALAALLAFAACNSPVGDGDGVEALPGMHDDDDTTITPSIPNTPSIPEVTGEPVSGFTSIDDFITWLNVQPTNTSDTAYNVKLNVSDLGGYANGSVRKALEDNSTKYIYLDLSESTVTEIGIEAFSNCISLTGITIPNSVKWIWYYAFSGCTSLTSVTIPDSVTSIGEYAFNNCSRLIEINVDGANTTYSSVDGVLYNKNKTTLIKYPEGKIGASFIIPDSVTSIEDGAFEKCTNLTSVTIPNSVTGIYDFAFSGCTNLTNVTIPNSVEVIAACAFEYCTSLTSVTIPNNVTSIGYYAFYRCSGLTSVTFERAGININGTNTFIASNYTTSLKTVYTAGGIGTYTRPSTSSNTWTKQ